MPDPLPVIGQARPERADAAENRRKLLAAAAKLFAEGDPATVTMEEIANQAGVGKGTLFRRFGDRASLVRAVLSDAETQLQEQLIRGAPPLGPGAPPLERLEAFGRAYLQFLDGNATLLRHAESSADALLRSSVYGFYRMHVAHLLREGGLGERAEFLSDVVLAPLTATMFLYFRDVRGLSIEEIADAHADLCARLLDSTR